MYVLCLWELYYCVSLAMRWVECVKCVEGVWCSCRCLCSAARIKKSFNFFAALHTICSNNTSIV